jgi:hypothetical protein
MARIKKSLWKYYHSPVGIPSGGDIGNCKVFLKEENFGERLSMLAATKQFLPKHPDVVSLLQSDPGLLLILLGDCHDYALDPSLTADQTRKGRVRFLSLYSRFPDFTLEYMKRLRKAVVATKHLHLAMAFIRTTPTVDAMPIEECLDKQIADALDKKHPGRIFTEDTVKAARQHLAAIDAPRWEALKGKK